MFRRFVSAALLVSYVVGQLAALPHVHAAQSAEHGQRAHYHGDWLSRWFRSSEAVYNDGHRHDEHAHDHDGQEHQHSEKCPVDSHSCPTSPQPAESSDHHDDGDCVYLSQISLWIGPTRLAGADS